MKAGCFYADKWRDGPMAIDISNYSDPRDIPRYSIKEAALYLHIRPSTLRSWVAGRDYVIAAGPTSSKPVIDVGRLESGEYVLSFYNLAEAHVLSSIRFVERVKLPKIRRAIEWLKEAYPTPHPLINHQFFSDGAQVFVKKLFGRKLSTINASQAGQLAIAEFINPVLNRVEYADGMAFKIYPSVPNVDAPKIISMSFRVASGRPVIDKQGIRAQAIWSRYKAGETVDELASDYEIKQQEVQAAIDYVNFINPAAA